MASGVSTGASEPLPECRDLRWNLRSVGSIEVRGRRIIDLRLPFHSPARAQRGAGGQHVHQRTPRGEPTLLMARHPLPAESGQEAVEGLEVFVIDRDGQVDVPRFPIDIADEEPICQAPMIAMSVPLAWQTAWISRNCQPFIR